MSTSAESLPAVSRTALGVAALRARESERPDHLFTDPLARAFHTAGRSIHPDSAAPQRDRGPGLGTLFAAQVAVRTRFYDDYLVAAGCHQVVLLAAGLDARAFRLDWPVGTRLFEIDLPEVLAFKHQVLTTQAATPRCTRTVVPADLRENWSDALRANGFRPEEPTAWLIEGLLIYLAHDEAAALLTQVGALSAPDSTVAFEHGAPGEEDTGIIAQAKALPVGKEVTDLWQGGLGPTAPDWLTDHGWRATFHPGPEVAAGYDRAGSTGPSGFLTALRNG